MDPRKVIMLFALAACAGPRPEARVLSAAASPQPGDQRVMVDLTNRSGGKGDIELRIVLREAAGAEVAAEQTVELQGHEHLVLAVDVPAPPGVYTAKATAEYPD